jgi:hypothetical protein
MSLGAHHEQFGTSVRERIAALAVACIAIALRSRVLSDGRARAAPIPGMPSALAAAAIVALLVTAAILRNQYCATGFPPYAFLGAAYLCAGGLMLPLAIVLTRPARDRPIRAHYVHVTMWLDTAYHAAFIALAGVYVWSQALFARKGALDERELERLAERDRDTVRGYAALTAYPRRRSPVSPRCGLAGALPLRLSSTRWASHAPGHSRRAASAT